MVLRMSRWMLFALCMSASFILTSSQNVEAEYEKDEKIYIMDKTKSEADKKYDWYTVKSEHVVISVTNLKKLESMEECTGKLHFKGKMTYKKSMDQSFKSGINGYDAMLFAHRVGQKFMKFKKSKTEQIAGLTYAVQEAIEFTLLGKEEWNKRIDAHVELHRIGKKEKVEFRVNFDQYSVVEHQCYVSKGEKDMEKCDVPPPPSKKQKTSEVSSVKKVTEKRRKVGFVQVTAEVLAPL